MRAVFLDRDGVICRHRPDYIKSWEEFEFIPGSLDALKTLAALEIPVVVISNQSCIGRGLVKRKTVEVINRKMTDQVQTHGGRIDEVLICPHRPDEGCSCRKPGTGLVREAASKYKVDLAACWVVGDNKTDMEMGLNAGCRNIVVKTGLGRKFIPVIKTMDPVPYIADDIREAVSIIIHVAGREEVLSS